MNVEIYQQYEVYYIIIKKIHELSKKITMKYQYDISLLYWILNLFQFFNNTY